MAVVRSTTERIATRDGAALITGESGVGKELIARALHDGRGIGPFVAINMAAVAESTASSAFFGHVRGAFTGAAGAHRGHFERADGGTLFLDEIGATPLPVQDLLLRVLETGEIRPLGAGATQRVSVRAVAATDTDLELAVREGTFRRALYHRLAGYHIDVPPLRARLREIGPLLAAFLTAESEATGAATPADRSPQWIDVAFVTALCRYHWPGNVRELANVVRRLVVASPANGPYTPNDALVAMITGGAARPGPQAPPREASRLEAPELRAILRANDFSVGATARALGISRTSLYERMAELDGVRTAADLSAGEIEAALAAHGQDLTATANALEVSRRGVVRRMTALSISVD